MKEYNIKNIKQEFKEKGIYYTQPELAEYLKSFLPSDVKEIYDPTCGNGGLLSVFDDDVVKYGQDINKEQVEVAKQNLKNFIGEVGDTLTDPKFKGKKFKYIVANPPFSIKWIQNEDDERFKVLPCLPPPSKADYAFLAHILYYLSDDGVAVALNFPGILYRGQREGKIRKWFVDNNYIDTVIHIDGDKFVDTKIATCVLILKKNKKTTDIKFIDKDKEYIATQQEIIDNDYTLSVSNYIFEEQEKENIDILRVEQEARQNLLMRIKNEIEFSKMVCEMENISIKPLLNDIKKLVRSYERKETKENKNQQTFF